MPRNTYTDEEKAEILADYEAAKAERRGGEFLNADGEVTP